MKRCNDTEEERGMVEGKAFHTFESVEKETNKILEHIFLERRVRGGIKTT